MVIFIHSLVSLCPQAFALCTRTEFTLLPPLLFGTERTGFCVAACLVITVLMVHFAVCRASSLLLSNGCRVLCGLRKYGLWGLIVLFMISRLANSLLQRHCCVYRLDIHRHRDTECIQRNSIQQLRRTASENRWILLDTAVRYSVLHCRLRQCNADSRSFNRGINCVAARRACMHGGCFLWRDAIQLITVLGVERYNAAGAVCAGRRVENNPFCHLDKPSMD